MLKLYKLISYFIIPIILLNLYFRLIKNKEDKKRYKERLGITDFKINSQKKIIWLHAASVGEFKSSDLIIEKYYQDFQILVTTTTKSSADYVERYYKNKVIHQYIPFDVPFWCSRFLDYWKPSLVLWIESDIWPNMLKIIRDKKINCLYINARISPKSFKRWGYLKRLYSESLDSFDKIFVQSQNDLKRIKLLSNIRAEYIGNLKLSYNNKIHQNNKKKFSIMIASSHNPEEKIIINQIKEIVKNKKLKICIAPRHPERIYNVIKLLDDNNFSYSLDSEEKNYNNDVVLIDSFGNLDKYFYNSDVVILGGSFISKGGHNPIEPAKFGCAIISGIHVYNWQNIYDDMALNQACIMINDINDLKTKLNELIISNVLLKNAKKKALDFSNKNFFDNETLFNEINLVLN